MSNLEQLPLFEPRSKPETEQAHSATLALDTALQDAVVVYLEALRLDGSSPHTVKAFRSDLNLLGNWGGWEKPIGDFSTQDLNRFLHWMLHQRDKPCSPKSYARRVTTLKNFFGFLEAVRAIPRDPSTEVLQIQVSSPLPQVLEVDEIKRVLGTTQSMRGDPDRPDSRPHLLATLLLQTGIKKSECMALTPADVDRSVQGNPILWIRYLNPRMRYKERKIDLDPAWLHVLDEYLEQRRPERTIFDCTARNLEYVLRDVADSAGVERSKLSFEALRWTCALRDYVAGMDHEKLRQKLGLSRISWRETSSKLAQLAEKTEA